MPVLNSVDTALPVLVRPYVSNRQVEMVAQLIGYGTVVLHLPHVLV